MVSSEAMIMYHIVCRNDHMRYARSTLFPETCFQHVFLARRENWYAIRIRLARTVCT